MAAERSGAVGVRPMAYLLALIAGFFAVVLLLILFSASRADAAGLPDPIATPVTEITNPVIGIVEPIVEPVTEPVVATTTPATDPIVAPVTTTLAPVTTTLAPVIEPV